MNLEIFNYENNNVRAFELGGQAWFVAKDVCEVLEIKNTTDAIKRLDGDEVTRFNLGGLVGEVNAVNEYGLYNLVLGSRKQEAKKFQRWVRHEVLPSIRKHGMYATPQTLDAMLQDPDTMIKTLQALKTEREQRQALERKVEEDKPRVLFSKAVETSHTSILIGALAKLIRQNGVEIGQNRLFGWLRDNGYLIKRRGPDYNMPTQYAMEREWFEVKERTINNPDGSVRITKTTMVTGKGQTYFINRFLGDEEAM